MSSKFFTFALLIIIIGFVFFYITNESSNEEDSVIMPFGEGDVLDFEEDVLGTEEISDDTTTSVDGDKAKSLVDAYSKLSVGMSRHEVLETLGEPDVNTELMRKEGQEIIGYNWRYYIYRFDKDLVNEKEDKLISVYFNADGYMHWAFGQNIDDLDEIGSSQVKDVPPGPAVPIGEQAFVSYINKAIGYTILRPDQWYWQHFNTAELQAEGIEGVLDYFIADRSPLLPFGSEYLGEIVIEVSNRDLKDFTDSIAEFTKSSVRVGGEDAIRYEKHMPETKKIQYHFTRNNLTFRIIYLKSYNTPEEEAIFESLVKSFIFD